MHETLLAEALYDGAEFLAHQQLCTLAWGQKNCHASFPCTGDRTAGTSRKVAMY